MKKIILKTLIFAMSAGIVFSQTRKTNNPQGVPTKKTVSPKAKTAQPKNKATQQKKKVVKNNQTAAKAKSAYLTPFYERKAERFNDGEISYINSEVAFELNSEDNGTGIRHIEYAVDDAARYRG